MEFSVAQFFQLSHQSQLLSIVLTIKFLLETIVYNIITMAAASTEPDGTGLFCPAATLFSSMQFMLRVYPLLTAF